MLCPICQSNFPKLLWVYLWLTMLMAAHTSSATIAVFSLFSILISMISHRSNIVVSVDHTFHFCGLGWVSAYGKDLLTVFEPPFYYFRDKGKITYGSVILNSAPKLKFSIIGLTTASFQSWMNRPYVRDKVTILVRVPSSTSGHLYMTLELQGLSSHVVWFISFF